ncbi:MAG: UvrD-helicase domain-containing protein [Bacteroidota bacterium]
MVPSASTSYLDQLNDVQRQAVTTTEGPVLVVAGPGSGKTRVLTYRIAYLLEQGAAPWEILALTFTNKAAREMKERIEKVVGTRASRVWAGTFHSLFARILRVEAQHIGYSSNFTIYDTDDSKSLIGQIIRELNLNKDVYTVNSVRQRISSAKSNLITPKLYKQNEELMNQDRKAKMPHLYKIYSQYTARCKKARAMDFDDLLYRLYELLQSTPEVLDKYRQKFRYLMVDEFQDTNHLQYSIVRKLVQYDGSPRNICVVGDDAQSIYAFRGATIQNILDFEKDFEKHGIQVFKLEQNYRSTEHIVQAANEIITYNRNQIQKRIWSDKGVGQKIKLIKAISDTEEGKRVADTIIEQKNRYHLANRDIAILYRTNAQSRIFEEYLRKYNIPYRIYGGLSFYQRKEVKDLIAYLRLVVNPRDDEAFRRIINFPKRAIGKTTVDKIVALAAQQDITMYQAAQQLPIGGRTRTNLDGFIEMIESATRKMATADAYQVATYIAKRSKLAEFYNKDNSIEGMGRQENLQSLLNGIQAFVGEDDVSIIDTNTVPDKSLASYIQNIALLTDFDEKDPNQNDVVNLMSIHAAKGLEFKSIFLTGMEEKLFPSFMSMDTPEGLDEERRLFYVAITRAESHLTISFAASRYRYGNMTYNAPSRFLTEIPVQHVENTANLSATTSHARTPMGPPAARVSGNFSRSRGRGPAQPVIDPKDFNPSPSDKIQAGMLVLHLKFGKGKVVHIDNGIAHIRFNQTSNPDKKIMLKFAKLQILE